MSEDSPLQEIEEAVQRRAKTASLDMAKPGGVERLRQLVEDEVARWSADFKRGTRAYDLPDHALVATRALRNIAGYGPLEPLLADDDVWEIMVNAPDATFWQSSNSPGPSDPVALTVNRSRSGSGRGNTNVVGNEPL